MRATVSILGLYNYNPEVLAGLEVPSGLNRDTLINYIFMECADLELLYPHIGIVQNLIASWTRARLHSWERLYQTTQQKYNMIHNYDRYEDWTDTNNRKTDGTYSDTEHGSGLRTGSGSNTENSTEAVESSSTDTGSSTGNTTRTIAKPGFNVETGPVTTETETGSNTGSTRGTHEGSEDRAIDREGSYSATENSNNDSTRSGSNAGTEANDGEHHGHLYGNIGVTTAAQMLEGERELYKWDVYQAIAQEFKERFCVLVY